jgi:hypothetical protein
MLKANVSIQKMEKEFQEMGYKTQIKQLSDFHDDYGLKSPDDEDDDDQGDEDEDEELASDESGDEDSDNDESMASDE